MITHLPTNSKEYGDLYSTVGTLNKLTYVPIDGEPWPKTPMSKDYGTLQVNATTQLDSRPITEGETTMWWSGAEKTAASMSLASTAERNKAVISE